MSKKTTETTPNTPAPGKPETAAEVTATEAASVASQATALTAVDGEQSSSGDTALPPAGASINLGDELTGDGTEDPLPPFGELFLCTHSITAAPEKGFCRAGRRWYREPTPVYRNDWTDEQWKALNEEPNLTVRAL